MGTIYGTVEHKIRKIVAKLGDVEYMFADFTQANVMLDNISKPTVLYILPASGTYNLKRDVVRDKPETMIWFICPSDFDFKGDENDCRIEVMKRLSYKFINELNKSGYFKPIEGDIPYQVGYDLYDENMTGICITPVLEEIDGVPLCNETYTRYGWDKQN